MLQAHVERMHACCDDIDKQLRSATKSTSYLLDHADGLRSQR